MTPGATVLRGGISKRDAVHSFTGIGAPWPMPRIRIPPNVTGIARHVRL